MCHIADETCTTQLAGEIINVTFSPDSKFFVVWHADKDKPGELRHADSGRVVPLAGRVNGVTFSPDSKSVVVRYADKPGELRYADSGQVVPLADTVGPATFSPDSKLFVVQYPGIPSPELRHTDSGQVVPLAGHVKGVWFGPDSKLSIVQYRDKPGELWTTYNTPHRLINDIYSVSFGQTAPYTIVLYTTGQVYLLNTAWLDTIAGQLETLSEAELIKHTCTELLSRARFDEQALQPYLGNRTPAACH